MATELHKLLARLTEAEKRALRELLDRELEKPRPSNGAEAKPREFGWARGQISMTSDFDEPLEDFKEYTE